LGEWPGHQLAIPGSSSLIACREFLDPKAFSEWGWRIPFIVLVILLVFSVYIRLRLNESPIFQKMKEEGKGLSVSELTVEIPTDTMATYKG
jgi:hypothetical protein